MKRFLQILTIALMATVVACKTAQISINTALVAEPMPVKGRNGFLIGQVIRYGGYTTDKVRRGWTGSYNVPFIVRFQGAKEKLSFTQYSDKGTRAEVSCISKFKSIELPLVRDFFSIPLDMDNFFAGNISFIEGEASWDFILYNPNGDFLRNQKSAGYARNGSDHIDIQPVRELKGQPRWMDKLAIYGFEFLHNGKVVATVSTMDRGTVWIDSSLSEEFKTVVAAVATGLLLRTDVEEVANSNHPS